MGYVYKYVFGKEIIHIGKTDRSLEQRIYQHGRVGDNIGRMYADELNRSKIYYLEFEDNYVTDMVETLLINTYKPKCNKSKLISTDIPINFNENQFKWKIFIPPKRKSYIDKEKYDELLKTLDDFDSCLTRLLDDESKYKSDWKKQAVKEINKKLKIIHEIFEDKFQGYLRLQ